MDPGELVHHVETKYIPNELGGQLVNDVEGWLLLQEHVETFSFSARRIARRLAQFVGVLNQVSTDNVKGVSTKPSETPIFAPNLCFLSW